MMDPDAAGRSFFDFAAEQKKETDKCCDKATKDVKEALKTISYGHSKMAELLAKLDKEAEEESKD